MGIGERLGRGLGLGAGLGAISGFLMPFVTLFEVRKLPGLAALGLVFGTPFGALIGALAGLVTALVLVPITRGRRAAAIARVGSALVAGAVVAIVMGTVFPAIHVGLAPAIAAVVAGLAFGDRLVRPRPALGDAQLPFQDLPGA